MLSHRKKEVRLKLRARLAKESDLMLIFNWANNPLTRKMSFDQDSISLKTHQKWFNNIINQKNIHLLIIEGYDSGSRIPLGQIRVDRDGKISMSLASEFRGQHLATPSIKVGIAYIKNKFLLNRLVAYIKQENIASVKAFKKAGFQFNRKTTIKRCLCFEYIFELYNLSNSLKGAHYETNLY